MCKYRPRIKPVLPVLFSPKHTMPPLKQPDLAQVDQSRPVTMYQGGTFQIQVQLNQYTSPFPGSEKDFTFSHNQTQKVNVKKSPLSLCTCWTTCCIAFTSIALTTALRQWRVIGHRWVSGYQCRSQTCRVRSWLLLLSATKATNSQDIDSRVAIKFPLRNVSWETLKEYLWHIFPMDVWVPPPAFNEITSIWVIQALMTGSHYLWYSGSQFSVQAFIRDRTLYGWLNWKWLQDNNSKWSIFL